MTRFYLENGQEVKAGSIIRIESEAETPFGKEVTSVDVRITEDIIPLLVKSGILLSKNDDEATIKSYIRRIARTHNVDFLTANTFINVIAEYDKFMALYMLLKAASEKAMCGYKGDNCIVIHLHNGKIYTIKNENIPSHLLVFPTHEEANNVIEVLSSLYKEVYGDK
jgi:hypothetical protein